MNHFNNSSKIIIKTRNFFKNHLIDCVKFSKSKLKLFVFINDLGILKIPKGNNNKDNISHTLGILFQTGKYL